MEELDPNEKYRELKQKYANINKELKELSWIKHSLLIFHGIHYRQEITEISNTIKDIQEKSLDNFKDQKTKEKINQFRGWLRLQKKLLKLKIF